MGRRKPNRNVDLAEYDPLEGGSLTKKERRMVRSYFEQGAIAFMNGEWSVTEVERFLARSEINDELKRLKDDFEERRVALEKVRFHIKIELSKLAPLAVQVIQRTLLGEDNPLKNEDGEPAIPPSKHQFAAAKEVLNLLGIAEDFEDVGEVTIITQDNRSITIASDKFSEDTPSAAEKRERIRSVVDGIILRAGQSPGGNGKEIVRDVAASIKPKKRKKKKRRRNREQ